MQFRKIAYAYEQIMIDKAQNFPKEIFSSSVKSEEHAIKLVRTVLDDTFGWTPEEAYEKLNYETLTALKLNLVLKYIDYPPEYNRKKDVKPLLFKAYPELTQEPFATSVYRVFYSVSHEGGKYPKSYFQDVRGKDKACLALAFAMRLLPPFNSLYDLYDFMSGPRGEEFLFKHHLRMAQKIYFDAQIDYFYEMLPSKYKNELLYKNFRVLRMRPIHNEDKMTTGGWQIARYLEAYFKESEPSEEDKDI